MAANTPLTLADNTILGSFLNTATIEFMFNTGNTTATNVITQQTTATTGVSWAIKTVKISMSNYKFSFTGSTNGTTLFNVNSTCTLGKNAWHHVAITFNAGNVTIYCNGTASGTGTVGTAGQARLFDTTAAMSIGGSVAFKIDELRISQGLRYTVNFTPPTAFFSTAD
ncbi:MAG: LamG-like jellyroll fold domain-containing protein [Silvanigrellaceae bacterium]